MSTRQLILAGTMLLTVITAQAGDAVIQFSADAVQMMPRRAPLQARIHVGKNAVRSEYVMDGRSFVEIVYAGNQGRVLLNPAQKQYVKQSGGHFQMPGMSSKSGGNPCEGVSKVTCRKLGSEMLNGRKAVKWEFLDKRGRSELRSLHWLDAERHFPVRQLFPDGTLMEMRFVRTETVGGRQADVWDWSGVRPDGESTQSRQWLDTEMNIAIREERPGGYVRELSNIKPATQPAALFVVPGDYTLATAAQPARESTRSTGQKHP